MKKQILILSISILLLACTNSDRKKYMVELTLLDDSKDTISFTRLYNKELHRLETEVVSSSLFNEEGLETAKDLVMGHPLGIFYRDTIESVFPELVEFSKISKDFDNPIDEKLIDNSIVFNRSQVVPKHVGNIKAFRVLSVDDVEIKMPEIKVLEFLNHETTTALELDAIPYISNRTAVNIIKARPYTSIEQLNEVTYVGEKTIERLKIYAASWVAK